MRALDGAPAAEPFVRGSVEIPPSLREEMVVKPVRRQVTLVGLANVKISVLLFSDPQNCQLRNSPENHVNCAGADKVQAWLEISEYR